VNTLELEPLSDHAFAPFGRVLSEPAASADADGPGWRWWGEVAALPNDGRRWAFGYLALEPVAITIDWAEHHLVSPEVVVASARDIAVYVAPPDPPHALSLDRFRVFEVPAGAGVVLDPGVWHGAPFALEGPTSAFVLLLEGTGRDDTTVVRFSDTPLTVHNDTAARGLDATRVKG
jgi:ureidoglycolate hydrolase